MVDESHVFEIHGFLSFIKTLMALTQGWKSLLANYGSVFCDLCALLWWLSFHRPLLSLSKDLLSLATVGDFFVEFDIR